MNIVKTIYNLLAADSGVTTLVSTRIYVGTVPQAIAEPYVFMNIIDTNPQDDKDGASKLDTYFLDIRAYAPTAFAAIDINNAVRSAIDRFTGLNLTNVVDKIIFSGNDGPFFDEEVERFRCDSEYRIRVRVDFGAASPAWDVDYIVNVNGIETATGTINVLNDVTINIEP
jgi:hypothetical protein